jgi:hypothetical protein
LGEFNKERHHHFQPSPAGGPYRGALFFQPTLPDPQQHVLSKMLIKLVVLPVRHDRPVLLPERNHGHIKTIYVGILSE